MILLIVGIFILTVLAEPLVESVRQFSESAKIEPFYVSFILVPLATNARTAIAAIRAAKQKRHHTTSLTFSEVCPSLDYTFIIYQLWANPLQPILERLEHLLTILAPVVSYMLNFLDMQIYHKVFLNNIMGFFVLISVIYFRGLIWRFSAEVLILVIVCVIMGPLAGFKSKFPNWTLLVAFPLYPLSMLVVYFVNGAFQFT